MGKTAGAVNPIVDTGSQLPDALAMVGLRLLYTATVMVLVIWLLRNGNPVGGLLLVPVAAVWLQTPLAHRARARQA